MGPGISDGYPSMSHPAYRLCPRPVRCERLRGQPSVAGSQSTSRGDKSLSMRLVSDTLAMGDRTPTFRSIDPSPYTNLRECRSIKNGPQPCQQCGQGFRPKRPFVGLFCASHKGEHKDWYGPKRALLEGWSDLCKKYAKPIARML